MGHKVTVKPIPHINKNGQPAKVKKDLLVRCRSRGNTCLQERVFSREEADTLIENHRDDAFDAHRAKHPNDIAHVEKHAVQGRPGHDDVPLADSTPKQKPNRMAPRGKRGEKWWSRRSA